VEWLAARRAAQQSQARKFLLRRRCFKRPHGKWRKVCRQPYTRRVPEQGRRATKRAVGAAGCPARSVPRDPVAFPACRERCCTYVVPIVYIRVGAWDEGQGGLPWGGAVEGAVVVQEVKGGRRGCVCRAGVRANVQLFRVGCSEC